MSPGTQINIPAWVSCMSWGNLTLCSGRRELIGRIATLEQQVLSSDPDVSHHRDF